MDGNRRWWLVRVWSNEVLRSIAPLFSGDIINVSGWQDQDKQGGNYREYFLGAHTYYLSNYRGSRGIEENVSTDFFIDLTAASLPDNLLGIFDVVFNHTTLEHIFDVRTAFRNLCQMSRDVVIVVVPFAQHLHYTESYGDYWRFTPMSLRELFHENKFEVIYEAASPYSGAAVYLLFVGSCRPEQWRQKMPPWAPVQSLGFWIGSAPTSNKQRIKQLLTEVIRKGKYYLRFKRIS
jgi:hypothetical protein